jgi:hypothetical protein
MSKNNHKNGRFAATVQELKNQMGNMESIDVNPQLQYFSGDVAVKDTSDGPKVAAHAYGNNDEQTVNRAIVMYLDTIDKLEKIEKQGKKIRLTVSK